jgi:hypothetical protein
MYNNKGESKMAKEYNHSDHIAVLSELTTLYKLLNEIRSKIDMAEVKEQEMKVLQKKKEELDDEIPF